MATPPRKRPAANRTTRKTDRTVRTPKNREALLAALRTGVSITAAAKKAGIGRMTAFEWRNADPAFEADWEAAVEEGTDRFEDEAARRAAVGVDKPVFHAGKRVGEVREYSDVLLMALLNARRPEKFRRNANVTLGGRIETRDVTKIISRVIDADYTDITDTVAETPLGDAGERGTGADNTPRLPAVVKTRTV